MCCLPMTPCQGALRLCWLYTTSCTKLLNPAVPARVNLKCHKISMGLGRPGPDKHLDRHQPVAPSNPSNRPAYQVWTHFVSLPLTSSIKANPINSSRLQTAYLPKAIKTHTPPTTHAHSLSLSCSHKWPVTTCRAGQLVKTVPDSSTLKPHTSLTDRHACTGLYTSKYTGIEASY